MAESQREVIIIEESDYEEDCYFDLTKSTNTPSLDEDENVENTETPLSEEDDNAEDIVSSLMSSPCWSASSFEIDNMEDGVCLVETEFVPSKAVTNRSKFYNSHFSGVKRDVRVKFQDLSKPYIANVTNPANYRKFLQLVRGGEDQLPDLSPSVDSAITSFQNLSPEEQERQREEWMEELKKVEEEIQTLRHVLASKVRDAHELKRKLGFSVWKELQDDMSQGIRNVKESNVYQNVEEKIEQIGKAVSETPLYQKTESVVKTTAEKTTSIIGGVGSGLSSKLGQLKNSDSFRSFEEKVGSVYESVKTLTGRSNSVVSMDEGFKNSEAERGRSASNPPATTPIIPE